MRRFLQRVQMFSSLHPWSTPRSFRFFLDKQMSILTTASSPRATLKLSVQTSVSCVLSEWMQLSRWNINLHITSLNSFSQIGLLTKSSSTAHEQRIIVMNTKSENILITVKEHIPKSTDDKIKIKLFSPELGPKMAGDVDSMKKGELPTPGARLNSSHNLEWTVSLQPSSETELYIKWTVEHPVGETVEYREVF
uniref:DUF4139 domain-containing protein n=1 Tax=Parascaris univalens TaxID=6257 RepID=A0A915BRY0_PARUN